MWKLSEKGWNAWPINYEMGASFANLKQSVGKVHIHLKKIWKPGKLEANKH